MRRGLVLASLVALLIPAGVDAARGRMGRGAQGNLGVTVGNLVDPPPTSFVESFVTSWLTLTTGGYCVDSVHPRTNWLAAGNNAVYAFTFRTAPGTCATNTAHDFVVHKYDYATGVHSTFTVASKTARFANNVHDHGSLVRDPTTGYLWVFYGTDAAGGICGTDSSQCKGPFARRSTNPDDISAWQAEFRLPAQTLITAPRARVTANGTIYVLGQSNVDFPSPSGPPTMGNYDIVLMACPAPCTGSGSTWNAYRPIGTSSLSTFTPGDPGCEYDIATTSTQTVGILWGSGTSCGGAVAGLYWARSTNGSTFFALNGTSSFSVTGDPGLAGITDATVGFRYDTNYRVTAANNTSGGAIPRTAFCSDGSPVIAYIGSGGLSFVKGTLGGSWPGPTVVDSTNIDAARGLDMVVLTNDTVKLYAPNSSTWALSEYSSTSCGAGAWTETVIYTKGTESLNRYPQAFRANVGGAERVFVGLASIFPVGQNTTVRLRDRKQ